MSKSGVRSIITYVHYFQGHVEFHKVASISHLSQYGRQAWNGRIRASDFHLSECGFDLAANTWKSHVKTHAVNALPKLVGFLWVLRFLIPTGLNVHRVP